MKWLVGSVFLLLPAFAATPGHADSIAVSLHDLQTKFQCVPTKTKKNEEPAICPKELDAADVTGIDQKKFDADRSIILVGSSDMSGAYNPIDYAYLAQNNVLYAIAPLWSPDVDMRNNVISTFSKGRGVADYGTIEFYAIDWDKHRLHLRKSFSTDITDSNDISDKPVYLDEHRKKDVAAGYMKRAHEYALKNKLNFTDQF